ncbi:MAG TPA: hypothetical protein VIL72_02050 [Beijerinckiaceae bacterium]|jgi:hypothetical protein
MRSAAFVQPQANLHDPAETPANHPPARQARAVVPSEATADFPNAGIRLPLTNDVLDRWAHAVACEDDVCLATMKFVSLVRRCTFRKTGVARFSLEYAGAKLNLRPTALCKAVKQLEALGYFCKARTGRRMTNEYHLRFDRMFRMEEAAAGRIQTMRIRRWERDRGATEGADRAS